MQTFTGAPREWPPNEARLGYKRALKLRQERKQLEEETNMDKDMPIAHAFSGSFCPFTEHKDTSNVQVFLSIYVTSINK